MSSTYVALGDSISIDDYAGGQGRGGASLLYRNRDDDFPRWRGHDLVSGDPEAVFHLLASDGATTSTLLAVQMPRLIELQVRPTLVSVTVGGNDVLSGYGDTAAARAIIHRVSLGPVPSAGRAATPAGSGRPGAGGHGVRPQRRHRRRPRLGLPPWSDAVGVIGELNAALRHVAAEHGAAVAEIDRHFSGHGLLAGDATRPDPRPSNRDLWLCSVIEPNAWGAGGVRAAFWAALQASDA
jgi:hypothetical protein